MRRSEDRLFARFCRSADPRLLAVVFDRTAPELLRVAAHLCGDRARGEDLVQETFVTAIENRARFDVRLGVVPWLLGILVNLARRQRRTERRAIDATRLPSAGAEDPVRVAEGREFAHAFGVALRALPEVYRPVMAMHLDGGLTAREIGASLGRPAGTVRTQVVRGIELLRKLLPPGFAAAGAVMLTPERGLAALRAGVLARVPATTAATSVISWGGAAALLAGVLTMQKVIVGAALLSLLAAAGWWWWPVGAGSSGDVAASGAATPHGLSAAVAVPSATPETAAAQVARAPVVVPGTDAAAPVLRAQVAWSDGEPAADLGVYVRRVVADAATSARERIAVGRTGDDGALELTLPPGDVFVQTDRGGSAGARLTPGAISSVVVRLAAGITVRGTVVDAAGEPVRDATVLWLNDHLFRDRGCAVARTDASGAFVVRDMPAAECRLWAEATGLRPSPVVRIEGATGTTLPARLVLGERGHRLTGRVLDDRGAPIPHALVGVALPGRALPKGYRNELFDLFLLDADDDGRFALDWAPAGEIVLLARRRLPFGGNAPLARARVTVDPAIPQHFELMARELPAIAGVARDEEGQPIADARVGAFLMSQDLDDFGQLFTSLHTTTAADGSYRLVGLIPGRWQVHASFGRGKRTDRMIEVHPDAEARCDLALPHGHTQRVRLLDPQGRPLADWLVTWKQLTPRGYAPYTNEWQPIAELNTDEAGWATIEGLAPGNVRVFAQARYEGPHSDPFARQVHDEVAAAQPEVVARLRPEHMPTARVLGRIVTAGGETVTDAHILVIVAGGTTQRELRVDREGRFALGPMAPARLRLAVRAAGHPIHALADVDLLADATRDLGDVRLPAPARITVRTRLPSDVDPAGLRVALAHGTGPAQAGGFVAPPAGGIFASEPLAAGDYVVQVLGPRTHPVARAVQLREGQEVDLDIELAAARPVTLALTFSEEGARNGIAHGLLRILDRDGAVLVHEKLWSPFYDFTARLVRRDFALRPGEYTVEATDHAGRHERRVVTIGDDPAALTIPFDLR